MTIRFVDSACNTLDASLAMPLVHGECDGRWVPVNVYVCRLVTYLHGVLEHGYILEVDVADDGDGHWGDDDCPGSAGGVISWFGPGERFASSAAALEALYGPQEPIPDLEFLGD